MRAWLLVLGALLLPHIAAAATGVCRVATSTGGWSEYATRNAYTADSQVHKFSVCDGQISWQSNGSITVAECTAQARRLGGQCWDYLCPYKLAHNCSCPAGTPRPTQPGAMRVACVGDSITAGYLSSCGLTYPNQLQTMLGSGYVVTNYGAGGRTMLKQAHLPAGDHASYWNTSQYQAALSSGSEIVVLMLGTNDAMAARWALSGSVFSTDYAAMIESFRALNPQPRLYIMVPPPLYRDGRYNMNQTVINSLFPGRGPAGLRSIASKLQLEASQLIDVYSLFQRHCPVTGGTPGHPPNATDVPCDWIGWCSGVNSSECLGIDACHPNDVGYHAIAQLVHDAIVNDTAQ